ncbi:MAG: hypothetical protein JST55_15610 [Bacteroidetes bacterium]|nr:hypothetical protein [Bacteroidota bacterium]
MNSGKKIVNNKIFFLELIDYFNLTKAYPDRNVLRNIACNISSLYIFPDFDRNEENLDLLKEFLDYGNLSHHNIIKFTPGNKTESSTPIIDPTKKRSKFSGEKELTEFHIDKEDFLNFSLLENFLISTENWLSYPRRQNILDFRIAYMDKNHQVLESKLISNLIPPLNLFPANIIECEFSPARQLIGKLSKEVITANKIYIIFNIFELIIKTFPA